MKLFKKLSVLHQESSQKARPSFKIEVSIGRPHLAQVSASLTRRIVFENIISSRCKFEEMKQKKDITEKIVTCLKVSWDVTLVTTNTFSSRRISILLIKVFRNSVERMCLVATSRSYSTRITDQYYHVG